VKKNPELICFFTADKSKEIGRGTTAFKPSLKFLSKGPF